MNPDHIKLLLKGINDWNNARKDRLFFPDLSGEDLTGANLMRANLSGANLTQAGLREANLSEADLSGADLSSANLSEANLRAANLSEANLTSRAQLFEANLSGANLSGANLSRAGLSRADLSGADLSRATMSEASLSEAYLANTNLSGADLCGAHLSGAIFNGANLSGATLNGVDFLNTGLVGTNFSGANLSRAGFPGAYLTGANFSGANLSDANFSGANLTDTNLSGANLYGANLSGANLTDANLSGAKLSRADLRRAQLVDTVLREADLTGCRIHGISVWGPKLDESTKQQNLVITKPDEPEVTVDNIEVAQFIYLILNNQKIREVIDTITSKVVLILGRFTDERKQVLDALRDELRKRNYLPILFDFDKPTSRDTDETITLLARMARFVIADVSDAKAVLQELRGIVPDLPSVPVQPVIITPQDEPGMFDFFRRYPWFLPVHRYDTPARLLTELSDRVIKPSEAKVLELRATTVTASFYLERDSLDPQRLAHIQKPKI
jgi:uncharacterized protein YjbI with pentapeptide repeats